MKPPAQTYQLHIKLTKIVNVKVGKLGMFTFPAGYFIYTGSAINRMETRLIRHKRRSKKPHWHIDYLLKKTGVKITKIEKFAEAECPVNQKTCGEILVPKFGASDCNNRCGSHLKYVGQL